jgi:hypothetical protein
MKFSLDIWIGDFFKYKENLQMPDAWISDYFFTHVLIHFSLPFGFSSACILHFPDTGIIKA